MLNQCVLTGNLGIDPESFYSSEGKLVVSFPLGFQVSKEKSGWIRVITFSRLAEVVQEYLHKGARIAVAGTLTQDRWETDEGQTRSTYKILGHTIEFIKVNRGENQSQPPDYAMDEAPF